MENLTESSVCEISFTFNSVWFYTPNSLPLFAFHLFVALEYGDS